MNSLKETKRALRDYVAEMKRDGIKVTSPFNGGMDRETQRRNERRFALKCEVERAAAQA